MIYLLSYSPLANTRNGRAVAVKNGIPRYVDASCRREPDFEIDQPFVSGLCRPNFIATVQPSDVLVYVTNKRAIHRKGVVLWQYSDLIHDSTRTSLRRRHIRRRGGAFRTVASFREIHPCQST